jgi:type IX secretion system PorP/SprF family membrane protein
MKNKMKRQIEQTNNIKMKKLFLLPLPLFCLPLFSVAQDVHFSQMPETPLLLNPAEAALGHDVLAIINYKDQWKSISTTSAYKTFNVSGDFAFMKKPNGNHLGLGVDVFSDKAGDGAMATTTGQLHLSGVISANDNNSFSAGIYGGFGQRSLQYDKLYWDNQYDGMNYNSGLPSGEPATFANHTYVDFGAGLGWFYGKGHSTLSSNDQKTFNAGIALQHINQPSYSFYGDGGQKLPMRLVQHATADIGIKNWNVVLEPTYIVMIQGGHHEITAGMLFKYIMQDASKYTGRKKPAAFSLGGYYRYSDAFIIATRYEFSNYSIGMSYDLNLSNLKTASKSKGGFEISLRFMSPNPFGKTTTTKLFD